MSYKVFASADTNKMSHGFVTSLAGDIPEGSIVSRKGSRGTLYGVMGPGGSPSDLSQDEAIRRALALKAHSTAVVSGGGGSSSSVHGSKEEEDEKIIKYDGRGNITEVIIRKRTATSESASRTTAHHHTAPVAGVMVVAPPPSGSDLAAILRIAARQGTGW